MQPECNVCGGRRFGDQRTRKDVRCLQCGSLERTRVLQLVLFQNGLGAQSLEYGKMFSLGEDARRFLAVLSERCKLIGVRGTYTLSVLEHYGVKNAVVAGCPSYFWRLKPSIRITKHDVKTPVIAVNASRDRIIGPALNAKKREIEKALYDYLFQSEESVFVAQTEKLEICMGIGTPRDRIPHEHFDSFRQFVDPAMSDEQIEAQRDKFKVFTSIPDWMAELSRVDFVIGTRLHGCLMGLVAGIPSMLISIDSRTRELAEYFKIPTVSVENLKLPLDVAKLYADIDMTETIQAFPERFRIYREFLEANAVPHNLMTDQLSVRKDALANAGAY